VGFKVFLSGKVHFFEKIGNLSEYEIQTLNPARKQRLRLSYFKRGVNTICGEITPNTIIDLSKRS
jgi:hypothetical protein